jgi:hypothetical protein
MMQIRKLAFLLAMGFIFVASVNCSSSLPFFGPTATPTFTPTPTSTPTPTPPPDGILTGRVYLVDRDIAVQTTVTLYRQQPEDDEKVDEVRTDAQGIYSFLVTEPGDYYIQVSVNNLVDRCDNLKFAPGTTFLPLVFGLYGYSGLDDIAVRSVTISIALGDTITLDCDLTCY